MKKCELAGYLELKGVKPTANRILVLRALKESYNPMSLADLEKRLVTVDKSSIFRVLVLYVEHDIVHTFEDGRGILHYELCASKTECNHSDAHVHFYCELCRKSFCMDAIPFSELQLPEGFIMDSVSFVVKGKCPVCRKRVRYSIDEYATI